MHQYKLLSSFLDDEELIEKLCGKKKFKKSLYNFNSIQKSLKDTLHTIQTNQDALESQQISEVQLLINTGWLGS